jgi:hypothetical protein
MGGQPKPETTPEHGIPGSAGLVAKPCNRRNGLPSTGTQPLEDLAAALVAVPPYTELERLLYFQVK